MNQIINETILSGIWLYDKNKEREVHIIKSNFKSGSGDYEDDIDIREDQFGEFYGVYVGKLINCINYQEAYFVTIDEAKDYATTICASLIWLET